MGSTLSQMDDNGEERVVEYASKKFSGTERRYAETERECYVVVWSLRHFKQLIAYDNIIVFTCLEALYAFAEREVKRGKGIRFPRWMHEVDTYRITLTCEAKEETTHPPSESQPRVSNVMVGENESTISPPTVPNFLFADDEALSNLTPDDASVSDIVTSRISQKSIVQAQRREPFAKALLKFFVNQKDKDTRQPIPRFENMSACRENASPARSPSLGHHG